MLQQLLLAASWSGVALGSRLKGDTVRTQCPDDMMHRQQPSIQTRRRHEINNMTTPIADTNDMTLNINLLTPGHTLPHLQQIKNEDLIDNYLKVKTLLAFLEQQQQQRAAVFAEEWGGGCERCGERLVVLLVKAEMLRDELAGALWGVRKE